MKNKVIVAALALVAAFLVGFVPQYVKVSRQESELLQFREAFAEADLRDSLGLAYIEATQKNYGLAADSTGRFFTRVREAVNHSRDANRREALEDLLGPRDKIMAALAKGDAAVLGDLQALFIKTRAATRSAATP